MSRAGFHLQVLCNRSIIKTRRFSSKSTVSIGQMHTIIIRPTIVIFSVTSVLPVIQARLCSRHILGVMTSSTLKDDVIATSRATEHIAIHARLLQ